MKVRKVDQSRNWAYHKFGFLKKENKMSIAKICRTQGGCQIWMSQIAIQHLNRIVNGEEKYVS